MDSSNLPTLNNQSQQLAPLAQAIRRNPRRSITVIRGVIIRGVIIGRRLPSQAARRSPSRASQALHLTRSVGQGSLSLLCPIFFPPPEKPPKPSQD
ncbi:MAG: hypothetical protein CFK52_09405 [Chloracidobacterium sp. CP2_5A]|nr:MAG: hypothetical protein CFK52_09405 [Chloracidobacterium sp. CP2_5A]